MRKGGRREYGRERKKGRTASIILHSEHHSLASFPQCKCRRTQWRRVEEVAGKLRTNTNTHHNKIPHV